MSEEHAAHAADAHPPEHGEQGEHAEHGDHGGHGGGHGGHKGHDEGHGGGHGGSWLITYCDMITLLITFFICIVTFASRENGAHQHPRKRDSLLYGPGGSGIAGGKQSSMNHDSVIWRQLPVCALPERKGSEMPPLYSDPEMEATSTALTALEGPMFGTLADSYSMRTPLSLLFTDDGKLTPSGVELLGVVASSLRRLPYDIYLQVDDPKYLPRAVTAAQHLVNHEGLAPFRIGVGVRISPEPWNPSLWFLYSQRP
jgi:chemotaxis protein MotB